MNRSHGNRWFAAVVAVAILAAAAPRVEARDSKGSASGKTGRVLLAGGQDVLWVVRQGKGETADKFDLIIRSPGGRWRTLKRFSGKPGAVATYRDRRLLVVSGGPNPSTSVFSLSLGDDRIFLRGESPGARWNLRNPPAAICPVPPLGKSNSLGFIAVVPYERDRLSTATTASQPDRKHSGLTILQTVEGQWEPLSSIDNIPGASGARISAAAADKWVYVLLVGAGETTRLVAWNASDDKSTWKNVALPGSPQQPLTVSVLRNQPVLITMAPAATLNPAPGDNTPPKAVGIRLHIHELRADKIADNPQSIKYQGKPLTLPGSSVPQGCSLGKASENQLVLFWRDAENYRLALVELNGKVVENEEVDELLKGAPAFDTRVIFESFFIAIPALLLVFILIGRRKGPTGPLVLPAQWVPANLPKRLVATVIDYAPFLLLSGLVLAVIRPDLTIEDIPDPFNPEHPNMMVEPVVCALGSLIAWIIYGSIMEIRFGATLGKMAMRLEVRSADGEKADICQTIMRNLIRPIEIIIVPILIITAAMSLLTRTHQRLGDIMSRTVVVDKMRLPNPDDSQNAGDEPPKEKE